MEMMKKSGIALVLGALMIASIPSTTQCLTLPSTPIDLNAFSQNQLLIAAVIVYLPFYLLYHPSILRDSIAKHWLYQAIIGTEQKEYKEKTRNGDTSTKKKVITPSTGFFGRLDSEFLKPWEKTTKGVGALLSIAAFLKIITLLGTKATALPLPILKTT